MMQVGNGGNGMVVTAVNLDKTNFAGILTLLLPYNISHTAVSCCHPALASVVASLLTGKVDGAFHYTVA